METFKIYLSAYVIFSAYYNLHYVIQMAMPAILSAYCGLSNLQSTKNVCFPSW